MEKLRQQIIEKAKSLGFSLVGFSAAKMEEKYLEALKDWNQKGQHGEMAYMEKIEKRQDLTKILPDAKTVIVLATNYYQEQKPLNEGSARVARYAFSRDYHKIIASRLKKLVAFLKEISPDFEYKEYVDTGPILEKALAEQAGIGRIGKHGLLITPEFGSWIFLSEIITTLDLLQEAPARINTAWNNPTVKSGNVCGACRRCVDACPTGAIIAPGIVDSRLCISYLTIEHKNSIPVDLQKKIAETKLLFGCDICQEVCPHNVKNQKATTDPEFIQNPIAGDQLDLNMVLAVKDDAEFLKHFAGSPLMRPKRANLQKIATIIKNINSDLQS